MKHDVESTRNDEMNMSGNKSVGTVPKTFIATFCRLLFEFKRVAGCSNGL
ncbi:hypothetical protein SAMN05216412_10981 [Nitrosospira multiformis]|uniref:Uncharacterized protein n=1 Tax=Nitrosospira multiformis TaxID=1231 RepID=A0A1I0FM40_9PROT|nr:hypothetical protein SAMN05216412_10981 [Nitrosospira multiformis]